MKTNGEFERLEPSGVTKWTDLTFSTKWYLIYYIGSKGRNCKKKRTSIKGDDVTCIPSWQSQMTLVQWHSPLHRLSSLPTRKKKNQLFRRPWALISTSNSHAIKRCLSGKFRCCNGYVIKFTVCQFTVFDKWNLIKDYYCSAENISCEWITVTFWHKSAINKLIYEFPLKTIVCRD